MSRVFPPLLLLAALAAPALPAQIVTDRPDFVESSATVGSGRIQIETSVAHERAADGRGWSTPTLLRVGVGPALELRAESELLTRASVGDEAEQGLADLSLGAKWAVAGGGAARPAVALLGHVDLPTGSEPFRADGARPSLRLVAEWALPAGASLGVMPGVARERGPEGVFAAGLLGVVVGRGWGERLRGFVELELARIARSADGGTEGSWNAGAAWLLHDAAQLDAALSLRAAGAAPRLALTVGYSRVFGP